MNHLDRTARCLVAALLASLTLLAPSCSEDEGDCLSPDGCEEPNECADPDGCDEPEECNDPDGCYDPEECNDPDGCEDQRELSIAIRGLPERGAIITTTALLDGDALALGDAAWTVEPADSAVHLEGDRFRLLRTGDITIEAEFDTLTARTTLSVSAPPTIVFQRRLDFQWRLYRVDLDGENLEAVLELGDGREPTTAPGVIVFVSEREGTPALYSLSASCDCLSRITDLEPEHQQPALDEEGSQLAFVRLVGGIPKVYLSSSSGGAARRLTEGFGFQGTSESSPSFSPDGEQMVLSVALGNSPDLFIAEVAEGSVEPLLSGADFLLEPAWSPCGRFVAYAARPAGAQKLDLFLVELDTGSVRQLTDRSWMDAQPSWLADGRIVYSAATEDSTELRWMDPNEPSEVFTIPTGPEPARSPVQMRE